MDVESSTSKLVDEEGHAFRVNVVPEYSKRVPRALKYRRVRQQRRLRQKQISADISTLSTLSPSFYLTGTSMKFSERRTPSYTRAILSSKSRTSRRSQ
ncbi:hypothetical protein K523DRAFT_319610, partial [Schizophyllum commune Tattone D]